MTERDTLIEHVIDIQRQIRRRFAEDQHPLLEVNVTMSQLKLMITLSRPGGASGQELARLSGVGLATLTGIVDRLVAQDLVSRREDPQDRRVRRLELTEAGADLVNRVITAREDFSHRMLDRLDPAALKVVVEAYELLLDAANELGQES